MSSKKSKNGSRRGAKDPPPSSATQVAMAMAEPSLYIVDLPVGCIDLGFDVVESSPPSISNLTLQSPLNGRISNGHFIHGIIMPGVVVDNINDPNHLMELFNANVSGPRSIMVSPSPYYADPILAGHDKGPLYKHTLPTNIDLGLRMKGFPPSILFVQPISPLAGRIYEGQIVHALVVPGEPIFNLQSGAFTDSKVMERLESTAHIEGRQLVVKDTSNTVQQKGSSKAFDDCVIQ